MQNIIFIFFLINSFWVMSTIYRTSSGLQLTEPVWLLIKAIKIHSKKLIKLTKLIWVQYTVYRTSCALSLQNYCRLRSSQSIYWVWCEPIIEHAGSPVSYMDHWTTIGYFSCSNRKWPYTVLIFILIVLYICFYCVSGFW